MGRHTTLLPYGETEACASELIFLSSVSLKAAIGGFVCFDCCCLFVCFLPVYLTAFRGWLFLFLFL